MLDQAVSHENLCAPLRPLRLEKISSNLPSLAPALPQCALAGRLRAARSTSDSLAIDLGRVYTQLATTSTVERERLVGAALEAFDAAAFLSAHTGRQLLPIAARTAMHTEGRKTPEAESGLMQGRLDTPFDLERFDADDLAQYARESTALTFLGPQLDSEAIVAAPNLVLLGEPGSGKSTALRYLSYTLARAGLDPALDLAERLPGWSLGRRLPVFAPLLPLAKQFAAHPEKLGVLCAVSGREYSSIVKICSDSGAQLALTPGPAPAQAGAVRLVHKTGL